MSSDYDPFRGGDGLTLGERERRLRKTWSAAQWAETAGEAMSSLFTLLCCALRWAAELDGHELGDSPLPRGWQSELASHWCWFYEDGEKLLELPYRIRDEFLELQQPRGPFAFLGAQYGCWIDAAKCLFRAFDDFDVRDPVHSLIFEAESESLDECHERLRQSPDGPFPRDVLFRIRQRSLDLGIRDADAARTAGDEIVAGLEQEAAALRRRASTANAATSGNSDLFRGCTHGPNFEWVRWYGTEFTFRSPRQQAIIRVLWEAARKGDPWTSSDTIAREIALLEFVLPPKMSEAFKVNGGKMHEAWGSLIEFDKRALYRLAVKEAADLAD